MARRTTALPPVLPGYSYIRPLGSGGFADVFLFEQDMPRRVVAVKVLVDDAVNPDVLRVFNAEADILARLSAHPAIVTIFQASISADGRPYFVMEYCPDSMSTRYKKGPLPVADVLDAGVRIASALETAHRNGVLHRDIKPSNVLLTSLGAPVLADFGIASAVARSDDAPEVFAMSVPWSSPEVLQEHVAGSIPSEVWSLGATLHTLLTGRSPFEQEGVKHTRDQLKSRIIKASYVPTGRPDTGVRLEAALARTMQRDPERRFASMLELAEELRWAQYDLGLPPTALDVPTTEWAAAAVPVDFAQEAPRGPVISTVRQDSRRSARAETLASAQRRRAEAETAAKKPVSPVRAAVMGGVVGAVVVGLVVAGVLVGTGVL
ncbi:MULTISPECIES: serine/threonine-protein kinase [unclassified Salinibacterium]|uniref:serine/threonine-protein kinase n=1 Tax=unclassified Salinibacterium TaxID=2632331 RepID=UPI001423B951|nr:MULTISPECIES: serine/threonine-protein kinase [unclassified Salinibacterium]